MEARYQIERETAGEGGYGRIDKAVDTELDRPVAIKTLDPLFRASPTNTDVERFRREAKALARLSHPNIPAIYDVDFSQPQASFVSSSSGSKGRISVTICSSAECCRLKRHVSTFR